MKGDRYEFYRRRQLQQRPGAQAEKAHTAARKAPARYPAGGAAGDNSARFLLHAQGGSVRRYYDLRQAQHGLKLRTQAEDPVYPARHQGRKDHTGLPPRLPHGRFGGRGRIAHDHLRL